jgi:hypothetical protein
LARSIHKTLLPLDQWAENIGINPWIFNQFDNLKIQGKTSQCQSVWYQRSWNGKYLSRDEIAYNIARAEDAIAEYTKIWVGPKYIENEKVTFGIPRDQSARSLFGVTGRWKKTPLSYLHTQIVGTRVWEKLDDLTLIFDLTDFETPFETTYVNASAYALGELVLVFPEEERNGDAVDDTWVIRPVKNTEVTGTVTFKGPKYLLAKPSLQNVVTASSLDPTSTDSYIAEAELYRVYIDTTHTVANPAQGVAIWNVEPQWWGEWCNPTCGVYTAPLCLQAYDADAGVVQIQVSPTDWPLWSWANTRGPDKMQINYIAGLSLQHQKVNSFWADIVTKLSISMLPSEDCGCDRHNGILKFWRMLPSEGNETARPLTMEEINSPFGPKRGARHAWELMQRYAVDEYSLR